MQHTRTVPDSSVVVRCSQLVATGFILAMVSSTAISQPQSAPDWPCIQVLVPEVVPAVVWPEPIEQSIADTWRDDADLQNLAVSLADIDALTEANRQAIRSFAEAAPPEQRKQHLSQLAFGIISSVNQRRSKYIDGIKRYTRQQIVIADQIEASLNELAEQPENTNNAKAIDAMETLRWHERLYDQRERAIRSLCERPVHLEENLSNVMRELAYHLPE